MGDKDTTFKGGWMLIMGQDGKSYQTLTFRSDSHAIRDYT